MLSFLFQVPPMHCMLHSATLGWQARYHRARRAVAHASVCILLHWSCTIIFKGSNQQNGLEAWRSNIIIQHNIYLSWQRTQIVIYHKEGLGAVDPNLPVWKLTFDYKSAILQNSSIHDQSQSIEALQMLQPYQTCYHIHEICITPTGDCPCPCGFICLVQLHISFKQTKIWYQDISFEKEVQIRGRYELNT